MQSARASHARNVSSQSCSSFSASIQTFRLTACAFLNTQKYGLFLQFRTSANGYTFQSSRIRTKKRRSPFHSTFTYLALVDIKEPTPLIEKSKEGRPRWCGQPLLLAWAGWLICKDTNKLESRSNLCSAPYIWWKISNKYK